MFPEILWAVPAVGAGVPAGLVAWRHWYPTSWNYGPGLFGSAARVYFTWQNVAEGCGLSKRAKRWNPKSGTRQVERKPGLSWHRFRPTAYGFRLRVRLHQGQTPKVYAEALEELANAWRVHSVRVRDTGPGWVELVASTKDPLLDVSGLSDESGELLVVRLGTLENGEPWVIDFRAVPHYLVMGATQSGKSTDVAALVYALARQPVAMVGFDLKGGVELTPYERRMSKLATTRAECVEVLDDLVSVLADRMATCRAHRVRNIWKLPEHARPMPVVALVDEVAELFLMADKSEKDEITKASTALLRIAQLGRAFGVHLVVCGQRVGADLGPGVTALRSQLSGRICHRVNDGETAKMALGDIAPDSLEAALSIPAEMPGVAVTVGADGRWHRARSFLVTEETAEEAASEFADLAPAWGQLTGGNVIAFNPDDVEDFEEEKAA